MQANYFDGVNSPLDKSKLPGPYFFESESVNCASLSVFLI